MSRVANALRETQRSLATVFGNPGLRRVNLAFAGSAVGDWAYATAIVIWAYDIGGVRAVGVWFTIRLILLTLVTPFAATLVDRLPRKLVLIGTDLIRGAICLVVAGLVWVDAWPPLIFVLATITSLVSAPFRPALSALLPGLARTPDELAAANGTTSTIESLAFFLGPALGGLLVGGFGVPIVVVFNAVTFAWSALLVSRIELPGEHASADELAAAVTEPASGVVESASGVPEPASEGTDLAGAAAIDPRAGVPGLTDAASTPDPSREQTPGFFAESMAGFQTIWHDPRLRLISGVYCAQTIVAGASAVFTIEMAVQMTDFGAHGVGYLDSTMGVGAILGGLVAIGRAQANKMATDFGVGVVLWAAPLALAAIWPQMWAALLALFIIGVANPVVDVNAATILQRIAPDEVLGRVFGALEAALIAAMALGAAITPLMIHLWGLERSLGILALLVTAAVLPAFGRLRAMNRTLREPEGLALLRQVPLFAPLPMASLEAIAGRLIRVEVPAGEAIISEGTLGDRFYVIESGAMTASFHGAVLSHMGPGDPFGEISLLRDVPRTATVTADQDSVLIALERQAFLDAVTGNDDMMTRADDLIARRIPTY